MIALLRGQIVSTAEDSLVIDTGGVGYRVHCSARTLNRLERTVELRIVTQVREDSITLYGFLQPAEEEAFRLLQAIPGVGARLALAILSVLEPAELAHAVAAGDKAPLTRANGVGPRLAQRVVSELKERVTRLSTPGVVRAIEPMAGAPRDDALSALIGLGYGRSEAYAVVVRVEERLGAEAGLDVLIRESLRELAP